MIARTLSGLGLGLKANMPPTRKATEPTPNHQSLNSRPGCTKVVDTFRFAAPLSASLPSRCLRMDLVNMWLSYQEATTSAVHIQREKALAAAERVAQFVGEIETQIGWTTRAEWVLVSLEQRRYDLIRLLRQVPAITDLVYIDGNGREPLPTRRRGCHRARRSIVSVARRRHRWYWAGANNGGSGAPARSVALARQPGTHPARGPCRNRRRRSAASPHTTRCQDTARC